jgi:hypothetical protein
MAIDQAMKSQITLGNLLSILIPVFIIVLTWGNSVETRLKEAMIRIQQTERINAKIEVQLEKMLDNQTDILIELQNKQNRE